MRFWHYTSATYHLPVILASRDERTGLPFLKTTDSILYPDRTDAPACVWLLDTPDLAGADHGLGGSVVNKRTARFEVEIPYGRALRWVDWARGNLADPAWLDRMVDVGGGPEAAEHWFCVFRRIPSTQWVRVERWDGAGWVDVPFAR